MSKLNVELDSEELCKATANEIINQLVDIETTYELAYVCGAIDHKFALSPDEVETVESCIQALISDTLVKSDCIETLKCKCIAHNLFKLLYSSEAAICTPDRLCEYLVAWFADDGDDIVKAANTVFKLLINK